MRFGDIVKSKRIELGMTQAQLGRALGVSSSAVSMYEQNNRIPKDTILYKLSRLFGMSIDELLGFEKEPAQTDRLTQELLEVYRKLNDEQRQAVVAVAKSYKHK